MTEYKRFELLDGVYLTAVRTDACGRGCLSMTFLTQLDRETAAMNAVLPDVLRRGSSRLPDAEAIDAALTAMNAEITPAVGKLGELQTVGLRALFPADEAAFEPMARELTAMLLSPNTRGGLLRPDWVKEAAAALQQRQAEPLDAEGFARRRLIEEMCCCERRASTTRSSRGTITISCRQARWRSSAAADFSRAGRRRCSRSCSPEWRAARWTRSSARTCA